jgi:hypothetical protein
VPVVKNNNTTTTVLLATTAAATKNNHTILVITQNIYSKTSLKGTSVKWKPVFVEKFLWF